jgi:hypothetical protein
LTSVGGALDRSAGRHLRLRRANFDGNGCSTSTVAGADWVAMHSALRDEQLS